MKILQVVHSLPFNNQAGTEIYTQDLSFELSKRNEVYIFCRACEAKQQEYAIAEKNFGKIRAFSINNTFKHCNSFEEYYENHIIDEKFSRLLDDIKPDIVHIQHLIFLSTGLIMKIKKRGIPIVFTLHDYWLMCPRWHIFKKDNKPCVKALIGEFGKECAACLEEVLHISKGAVGFYRFSRKLVSNSILNNSLKKIYSSYFRVINDRQNEIEKLKIRSTRIKNYLENVDIFLAPSEYIKGKFTEFGIPNNKIELLRPGSCRCLFAAQKPETDKIRFAFIGTLLPAKGAHILIEAFNGIRDGRVELKIFGKLYSYAGFEDYLSYLKKIIKNKNIKLMGEFDHNKIADIFKEIDMLIVPSLWYENSPLVIQEAVLSKTPVIASRIGGIPELIRDGVNGFLFEPGNVAGLQKQIISIINNRRIIEELGPNPAVIKSVEDNCLEIEDIYRGLLNKSKVYDYLNV